VAGCLGFVAFVNFPLRFRGFKRLMLSMFL